MAKPRRKQQYTPALLENLRYRFEETEESIVDIARSVARSHTTLRTLASDLGWTKYEPPPLDLTPAARLAAEAAKLAAEVGQPASLSHRPEEAARSAALEGPVTLDSNSGPPSFEACGPRPLAPQDDGEGLCALPPDPSPPLAALAGGGEDSDAAPPDLSNLTLEARMARLSRMARALDFQLVALRQKQAHPQRAEDMKTIDAEVKSLAATSALIEHQLQDLQRGQHARNPNDDDRRPVDIDERRRRLAERIREFVRSRQGGEDAGRMDGAGGG